MNKKTIEAADKSNFIVKCEELIHNRAQEICDKYMQGAHEFEKKLIDNVLRKRKCKFNEEVV